LQNTSGLKNIIALFLDRMNAANTDQSMPIQYSCYFSRSREGEQFIPEHVISYVVAGTMTMNDGITSFTFSEGDVYFCRRGQLAKYMKEVGPSGEFRSVSIFFDQEMLRNFSIEFSYTSQKHDVNFVVKKLLPAKVMASYMDSLRAYEPIFASGRSKELLEVKRKEAILLLLQTYPELKNVLFDFSEPGKIDLEAFMNQHYHFNVGLNRFAYLTGRSLSTFKRDFEKIFNTTPSRWLLLRRLQEAYYLLKEKKKAVSDVYPELGFEDLSHFSYAFKKQYGIAPSQVGAV
jgi:AraC-like DNA-binding protein